MNRRGMKSPLFALAAALAFTVPGASPLPPFAIDDSDVLFLPTPGSTEVITLRDFTEREVKGAGFVLTKDMSVHITALGGGDRVFWRDMFDDEDESRMYAAGWIIDADTRERVWEMTYDNTSGKSSKRSFDGNVDLKRGAYEVYFSAHGFYHSSTFSTSSMNIDRRPEKHRSWSGGNFFGIFGGDSEDMSDEFMEYAKGYGISVSVDDASSSSVQRFEAPLENKRAVFKATRLGDGEVIRKGLTVSRDLTLHVYALGEGRKRDEIFDYGWILNSATRERVWSMNDRNVRYAGGASKNIRWTGDVQLAKGTYELTYVTDDSHSNDDWNAKPPYDPFNYGITISTRNDGDASAVKVTEVPEFEHNVIVNLTRVRDEEFVSAGFKLNKETKLHVYALGERDGDEEMADYGWIVDAKTRERVWSMEDRETEHAGGATKNRLVDEIITLPKGSYIAYYQTDGSHSYNDWNSDPPFDQQRYGLTVMGAGEGFDPKSVTSFTEEDEADVIAQIIRVRDDRHASKEFKLDKPTKIRIYAIGEGVDDELADYGWIEDAKTGRTVWEMTYDMTTRAGGAKKNRLVSTTLTLEKGEYELHYRTDDSHSYNDWNDSPPEDRTHWGITIYKQE